MILDFYLSAMVLLAALLVGVVGYFLMASRKEAQSIRRRANPQSLGDEDGPLPLLRR